MRIIGKRLGLRLSIAAPVLLVLLVAVPGVVAHELVRSAAARLLLAASDAALLPRAGEILDTLLSRLGLLFAGAAAVATGVAVLAGIGIARSARRLTEWAESFREGGEAPLRECGPRELATLCRALNRLGSEVRSEMGRLGASEDRFRGFIECMSEGMVVVDGKERITFANRRFAEMLGVDPDALAGLEVTALLDAENKERVLRESRLRRAGKPGRYELCWNRRDGEKLVTLVSAAPLMGERGRFRGSFAVITDLTDRRRIEEQMSRAEKLRALGELAGGLAHDFNNRLTAILGNAQLLLMETEDERLQPGLRVIEKSALDGAETVRRVLEFSRSRPEAAPEDVDVGYLIDEVIDLLRYRRSEDVPKHVANHRVHRDYRATRAVHGYPTELREALLSVLTNAFDAMPGGGELRVTTYDHEKGVGIRISDSGHGMCDETARCAFDPFFTTRGVGRTGLGLSIAYGIARRHEGRISIRSEEGRGTTVTFLLPASATLNGRELAESDDADAGAGLSRILVVDDEEGVLRLLELALGRRGHAVDTALGAAAALDLLGAGKAYDVLLTDLAMPGMSGLDLAEHVRKERPEMRIALLTGWGPEAEERLGRSRSVDLVLRKPFSLPELVASLERLLIRVE